MGEDTLTIGRGGYTHEKVPDDQSFWGTWDVLLRSEPDRILVFRKYISQREVAGKMELYPKEEAFVWEPYDIAKAEIEKRLTAQKKTAQGVQVVVEPNAGGVRPTTSTMARNASDE
jgi:hypothetical protein